MEYTAEQILNMDSKLLGTLVGDNIFRSGKNEDMWRIFTWNKEVRDRIRPTLQKIFESAKLSRTRTEDELRIQTLRQYILGIKYRFLELDYAEATEKLESAISRESEYKDLVEDLFSEISDTYHDIGRDDELNEVRNWAVVLNRKVSTLQEWVTERGRARYEQVYSE